MMIKYCCFCGSKTKEVTREIDLMVCDIIDIGPPIKTGPPHKATETTNNCISCGAIFHHYEEDYINIQNEGKKHDRLTSTY